MNLPKKIFQTAQETCDLSHFLKMTSFYGSTDVVTSSSASDNMAAIRKLVSQKRARLMVVSDFDHTLTKFTSPQCHDIVGFNEKFSSDFIEEFNNIFIRPSSTMAEWWTSAHELITKKSGLTKSMLQSRLDEQLISVRDGLQEFAVSLRLHRVPLVIVSAGIRDVIAHTLSTCNIPTDADHLFHIDANYLEFHASGNIADILPREPVHSESKMHVVTRAPHMFECLNNSAAVDILEVDISTAPIGNVQEQQPEESCGGTLSDHKFSLRSEDNSVFLMEPVNAKNALAGIPSMNDVCKNEEVKESSTEVVAIVLGDRPADFSVMDKYPQVTTFRVGFARSHTSRDVQLLLRDGMCDVVFVGEEHGLEAVHRMVDELIQLRNSNSAIVSTSAGQTAM